MKLIVSRRRSWTSLLALLLVLFVGSVAVGESGRRRSDEEARSITDSLDCDACHDQTGWKIKGGVRVGGGYDHDKTGFSLVGRHRDLGCIECHQPGKTTANECSGCHESTHQGRLGRECDRCHNSLSWNIFRSQEIHLGTRLPLTGVHALADCTECHLRSGEREWTSVPSQCYACHEDDYRRSNVHPDHTGASTSVPFPRDCSQCHVPTGWSPAIINPSELPGRGGLVARGSHDVHFPITYGPHHGAPCEACHLSSTARRALQCTGCHAHNPVRLRAIHGRRLVSFASSSCLTCHAGGVVP